MYIVLWLRSSGLEVKESHMFKDPAHALKKFMELDLKASGSVTLDIFNDSDLVLGKKMVAAYGTSDIIHAFKIPE